MKCWNKRGEGDSNEVLHHIMELIIAGVVIFLFINAAVSTAKSLASERTYLANDIGITLNAIHSVPGGISYNYNNEDLSKYKIVVLDGLVKVMEPEAEIMEEHIQTVEAFAGIKNTITPIVFEEPLAVTFIKKEGSVQLLTAASSINLEEGKTLPNIETTKTSCSGDCQ